jgi:DNA-binding NarL/FixJ family response regulator
LKQSQSDELLHEQLKKLGLSRRESEVATLVCEGFENKQIGERLFISEYTVQNHLKSIYEKLDVKNRTSLARKVMGFAVER